MSDRETEELVESVRHLWARLSSQMRRDPELAALVRQSAMALIKSAEGGGASLMAPAIGGYAVRSKETPYATGYVPASRVSAAVPMAPESAYGDYEPEYYRPAAEAAPSPWGGATEAPMTAEAARRAFGPDTIDLNLISERARLKAEGVRWAWTRERRIHAGADFRREIQPNDQSLVHRAKALANCYMWMNDPFGPRLTDQHQMETLAGCFETLAESVALVKEVMPDRHKQPDLVKQALTYMAQSQSALRMVVRQIYDRDDQDQMESYQWLRRITQVERIYLSRYMRLDDPADPSDWVMIHDSVSRIEMQLDVSRRVSAAIKSLVRKLAYETSQVAHLPADLAKPKWDTVFEIVGELVAVGMSPSHPDMINPLLHIAESIPSDVEIPDVCRKVWDYIEAAIEDRDANADTEDGVKPPLVRSRPTLAPAAPLPVAPAPVPAIRSVAQSLRTKVPVAVETPELDSSALIQERLRGRSIVLVSGEAREPARRALQSTLGLKDLIWFTLHGPEDVPALKADIMNPDVALVMVAPKAAERARDDLARVCESSGKPMVRLSIGYAPSAVLSAIVNQAGERLTAFAPPPAARREGQSPVTPIKSGLTVRRSAASSFGQNLDLDDDQSDLD